MQEISCIYRVAYSQSVQLLLIPSEKEISFMLLFLPIEMANILMCFVYFVTIKIILSYNIQNNLSPGCENGECRW